MKSRFILLTLSLQALSIMICFAQHKPQLMVTSGKHQYMPTGAFSPDGKLILTSDGVTGKIWDAQTGKFILQLNAEMQVFDGPGGLVPSTRFEFSPDGKWIAMIDESVIKIWEVSTLKEIISIKAPDDFVDLLFSETGQPLMISSRDHITITNLTTKKIIKQFDTKIEHPFLSADKRYLIDMGEGGLFNLATGNMIKPLQGLKRAGDFIGFEVSSSYNFFISESRQPDGDIDLGLVYFWDSVSGELLDSLSGKNYRPKFSPDGKMIVTVAGYPDFWSGQNDYENFLQYGISRTPKYFDQQDEYGWESNARVWDASTRKLLFTLEGHQSVITNALFSLNGKYIVTASSDSTARVWDAKTGANLTILKGHKGLVYASAFNKTSQYVITGSWDRTCKVWEIETGRLVHTLKPQSLPTERVYPNQSGEYFVAVDKTKFPLRPIGGCEYCQDRDATLWENKSGSLVKQIILTEEPEPVFSPDGSLLLGQFKDANEILTGALEATSGKPTHTFGLFPIFSTKGNIFISKNYDTLAVSDSKSQSRLQTILVSPDLEALISPDEKLIGTIDTDGQPAIWSVSSGLKVLTFTGHSSAVTRIEFSANGKHFLTISEDKTAKIWDLISGKCQLTLTGQGGDAPDAKFSSTGKFVHTSEYKDQKLWDVLSGKVLYSVEESTSDAGLFSSLDDSYVLVIDEHAIKVVNPLNAKTQKSIVREPSTDILHLRSKDVVFITHVDGTIKLWNIKTGKMIDPLLKIQAGVRHIDFSGDKKLMFITSMDGSVSIYKGDNFDQLQLTIYPISSGSWVVTHPSGLFDASPGAMDKLHFVQGLDIIDFNQLKERYYEPGLWKKVMAGEPLRNVVGMKSIDLPPDIQVGQVDGEGYLNINLTNRGGGIGEVNLFVNGKEAIKDARDANVKPDASSASLKVFVGKHKSIVKGQENLIAVKAWNKDHWVQSRGQIVSYHSKEIESYKPAVHILTCGVSDYNGNEIDLKYAAKDANDVSVALQLGAKKLFGAERSYVYNLTTSQPKEFYPTKVNILKVFEKISSTAHPLDVFVMYVSGHGINYGGQDGDWHYLTQEAYTASGSAYNDPAIRAQTTISSNELVELFKKVPALKQVLMLDACASGKVVDNLMAQKDIESSTLRALDRMRDRTGMHIITGCTADAVSYEASKYGQGVLTYSLLEGIRGAALREDRYVDVNKLFQYAQDRVPQLAEGIGGIQSPQVFSPQGSQSFDIGLLSDTEKKEIPIAKIRPVYVRSNFQDENEMEDVLGLGKLINESLNEVSSKGIDSQIIFVDVADYPEGCKLIGRYKKEGGQILLKLRKRCAPEDKTFDIKANNVEGLKVEILKVL